MRPPARSSLAASVAPIVPDVPAIQVALERSEPLVTLMQRLNASRQCMDAVRPVLPPSLLPHVQAGPLDDEGWTLVVANAAVSSKIRQLQPRMVQALLEKGLKVNAIRLRVQTC